MLVVGPSVSGFRGATDPWRGWGAVGRHVPRGPIVDCGPCSGGRVPVGEQSGTPCAAPQWVVAGGPAEAFAATLAVMVPRL